MGSRPRQPKRSPWQPLDLTNGDVAAVKALEGGTASPVQQQHALGLIINGLCGTYDMSFRPESPRDTDFQEGKRFVGLQLVKCLKVKAEIYSAKVYNDK